VKIREKVELGTPHKNIVEWAKTNGSDLIVISVCGKSSASDEAVGSVAAKVIWNALCPVLSIHARLENKSSQKLAAVG
jgi:nucleotide-binding universal stress UspA family protein